VRCLTVESGVIRGNTRIFLKAITEEIWEKSFYINISRPIEKINRTHYEVQLDGFVLNRYGS
jgi:hypothetical protein